MQKSKFLIHFLARFSLLSRYIFGTKRMQKGRQKGIFLSTFGGFTVVLSAPRTPHTMRGSVDGSVLSRPNNSILSDWQSKLNRPWKIAFVYLTVSKTGWFSLPKVQFSPFETTEPSKDTGEAHLHEFPALGNRCWPARRQLVSAKTYLNGSKSGWQFWFICNFLETFWRLVHLNGSTMARRFLGLFRSGGFWSYP